MCSDDLGIVSGWMRTRDGKGLLLSGKCDLCGVKHHTCIHTHTHSPAVVKVTHMLKCVSQWQQQSEDMWPLCLSLLPLTPPINTHSSYTLFNTSLPRYLSSSSSLSLPGFNFQGRLPGSACQALLSRLPPGSALLSLELTVMNERERERGMGRWRSERRRDKSATNQNESKMLFKQNEWESHLHASLWLQAHFHLFAVFSLHYSLTKQMEKMHRYALIRAFRRNIYFLN